MIKKNAERMKRAATPIKKIRPANRVIYFSISRHLARIRDVLFKLAGIVDLIKSLCEKGFCFIVFELFTLNLQTVNFLVFVTSEIIGNHLRVIEKITRKVNN